MSQGGPIDAAGAGIIASVIGIPSVYVPGAGALPNAYKFFGLPGPGDDDGSPGCKADQPGTISTVAVIERY